jgi:asparagine synthase (glutamine-hydrolysing)
LLSNHPYHVWLAEVADNLAGALPSRNEPLLEWGFQYRLPPWVTPAAADAVRELIRAEAHTAEPLAVRRGQHNELEMMQFMSRVIRLLGQIATRTGVTLAAPYYDTCVIEAGLAVRPEERITPWRYKPLIIEAMRGIVPDEILTRQTKDDFTSDENRGQRQHRADLLALCEDSRLARLGLIDANALREVCSRPLPLLLQDNNVLRHTVACEVWLRALEKATVPS